MTDNRIREVIRGSSCSKSYQFLFNWSLEKRQLPPSDAFLRVYMQSHDNHFESNTVAVRVSVKLQVTGSGTDSTTSETDETWTFLRIINVERNSSSWLEFNIEELLDQFWDPVSKQAIIVVTLKFDVNNCKRNDEVPMKLLHPIALRLNKASRWEFQPILLISTDNMDIKRAIANSYLPSSITPEDQPKRRKRDAPEHICQIKNFTVTFSDLGIKLIILPSTLNIRRCMGSCSIYYAPNTQSLTTNHARLMTSATSVYEDGVLSPNSSPPENPCCSPVSYYPAYLLKGTSGSYWLDFESDIIVKECGCR